MKTDYHYIWSQFLKHRVTILLYLFLFETLLIIASLLPLTFDDSVFMSTAKNVAYGNYSYRNIPFDPCVTTGFPVILPTALIFKLLSVGVTQARIISIVYFLCFLSAIYFFFRTFKLTKIKATFAVFLVILLCLFTIPNFVLFSLTLYGDIPALFFYLLAHIALINFLRSGKLKILFLAGILAGLSFSTKYIMGVGLLWLVVVFFAMNFRAAKTRFFSNRFIFIGGMVVPEILYRGYHLLTVGREQFAKDIGYLFFTYHVIDNAKKVDTVSGDLIAHIAEIKAYGLHPSILFLVPIFIVFLFPYFIKIKNYIFISLILFISSIYLWWTFLSHNPIIRHLSIATIVLNIVTSFLLIALASLLMKQKFKRIVPFILFIATISVILLHTSIPTFLKYNIPLDSYIAMRAEQHRVLQFVETHPHATFYYILSYSTPDLAFLSSKYFRYYDPAFTIIDKRRNNFLILSRGALKVRRCSPNPTLFNSYNFSICKL